MANGIDARLMRLLESALSKAGESKVADVLSDLANDEACKAERGAYDSGMTSSQNSCETLTATAAAKELGISAALVGRYCSKGRITATETIAGWAIPRASLDEFRKQTRQRGRPKKDSVHA